MRCLSFPQDISQFFKVEVNKLNRILKLSPFREAASPSAAEEFSNILWHPKVYYHVHKTKVLQVAYFTLNFSPEFYMHSVAYVEVDVRAFLYILSRLWTNPHM